MKGHIHRQRPHPAPAPGGRSEPHQPMAPINTNTAAEGARRPEEAGGGEAEAPGQDVMGGDAPLADQEGHARGEPCAQMGGGNGLGGGWREEGMGGHGGREDGAGQSWGSLLRIGGLVLWGGAHRWLNKLSVVRLWSGLFSIIRPHPPTHPPCLLPEVPSQRGRKGRHRGRWRRGPWRRSPRTAAARPARGWHRGGGRAGGRGWLAIPLPRGRGGGGRCWEGAAELSGVW